MKKLLLLILISFGFTNFSIANERVNLSCVFYESFVWATGETSSVTGSESLVVFPDTGIYIYDGVDGYYQTVGNEVRFSYHSTDRALRWDYSLDRTTTVFEEVLSANSEKLKNKYEKVITLRGKCQKAESLFWRKL